MLNLKNKAKSAVIYRGASLIDGAPIVAIAIVKSGNIKTGDMIQTYILCDDIEPRAANKTGADFAICGSCPHRGISHNDSARKLAKNRTCYVNIGQGVIGVYKAYKRGSYEIASAPYIAHIGANRMVRLGTYGDPAAVPVQVWNTLVMHSIGHTGYTHQKNKLRALCMQSADSLQGARTHWKNGARTFRIIENINEIQKNEILCPASKEAGYKTQCDSCKLCAGDNSNSKKSIAIVAHGTGKKYFANVA